MLSVEGFLSRINSKSFSGDLILRGIGFPQLLLSFKGALQIFFVLISIAVEFSLDPFSSTLLRFSHAALQLLWDIWAKEGGNGHGK